MPTAVRFAARSDIGLGRYKNNQDSAYAGPNLLVVADGVGGHAGGDIASSLAIAHLAPLDDELLGPDDALEALERCIGQANDDMKARAAAEPQLAGLGTTVTALLRTGNKLVMAHIGDSRAYLLRDGQLAQVTADHTFVQYLVDTGRITEAEAEVHPHRSVVLKVLGDFDVDPELDLSVREARVGDRWLLCSDGLSGPVSFDTLRETLTEVANEGECADALIQLALRAGGQDNITCIVADVVDADVVTDVSSHVVGAAAAHREVTSSGTGPAARAAALTPAGKPVVETEDIPDTVPRWRRILPWALAAAVLAGLVGGSIAGYAWTQRQYYVGIADGKVAIYQGIPQAIGPLELSTVFERTQTDVDTLPDYMQARLAATIGAQSLQDARTRVTEILALLPPGSTPSSGVPATPTPTGPATGHGDGSTGDPAGLPGSSPTASLPVTAPASPTASPGTP